MDKTIINLVAAIAAISKCTYSWHGIAMVTQTKTGPQECATTIRFCYPWHRTLNWIARCRKLVYTNVIIRNHIMTNGAEYRWIVINYIEEIRCVVMYMHFISLFLYWDETDVYFTGMKQWTFRWIISRELLQKQRVFNSLITHHLIMITCISCGNLFGILVPKSQSLDTDVKRPFYSVAIVALLPFLNMGRERRWPRWIKKASHIGSKRLWPKCINIAPL